MGLEYETDRQTLRIRRESTLDPFLERGEDTDVPAGKKNKCLPGR